MVFLVGQSWFHVLINQKALTGSFFPLLLFCQLKMKVVCVVFQVLFFCLFCVRCQEDYGQVLPNILMDEDRAPPQVSSAESCEKILDSASDQVGGKCWYDFRRFESRIHKDYASHLSCCRVARLRDCLRRAITAVCPFDQAIDVTEMFIHPLKTHEHECQYDSLKADSFPCVLAFYQNLLVGVVCFVIILITLLGILFIIFLLTFSCPCVARNRLYREYS